MVLEFGDCAKKHRKLYPARCPRQRVKSRAEDMHVVPRSVLIRAFRGQLLEF